MSCFKIMIDNPFKLYYFTVLRSLLTFQDRIYFVILKYDKMCLIVCCTYLRVDERAIIEKIFEVYEFRVRVDIFR